jgi:hypothetical protein
MDVIGWTRTASHAGMKELKNVSATAASDVKANTGTVMWIGTVVM